MHYIIAFLGQIAGYLLGKNSPEEMQSGKKYFPWLRRLFLALIIIYTLLTYNFNPVMFIIGLALSLKLKWEYIALGCLPISYLSSTLIFLYGLPYGTIKFIEKNKMQLLFNLVFFIPLIPTLCFNLDLSSLAIGLLIIKLK